MLMLALLAALAVHSKGWEQVIYFCKGADPVSEFSLVYDQRGTAIKNVKIVDRGSPRLSPDDLTRWRGRLGGQNIVFDFRHKRNGFWTSGQMRLVPSVNGPGHFKLTWSSTTGGVGGHVPMGSPDETADCTLGTMASR